MKSSLPEPKNILIGEWLQCADHSLRDRASLSIATGELDAREASLTTQALLASVLGKTRSWILAHSDAPIDQEFLPRLDALFERLCAGTPLPYLTGKQEFYGLDFEVSPDVLIPRPETELLIERALAWNNKTLHPALAVDVGTGSGCIAITLAAQMPRVRWLAIDISWKALQVARRNAATHHLTQKIHFVLSDLLTTFKGPFDLVCANLPYIPSETLKQLTVSRHEPQLALNGGKDGLVLIGNLLRDSAQWLSPGGVILLEMQFDQGEKIIQMIEAYLPGAHGVILYDLAGLPRVVEITT